MVHKFSISFCIMYITWYYAKFEAFNSNTRIGVKTENIHIVKILFYIRKMLFLAFYIRFFHYKITFENFYNTTENFSRFKDIWYTKRNHTQIWYDRFKNMHLRLKISQNTKNFLIFMFNKYYLHSPSNIYI